MASVMAAGLLDRFSPTMRRTSMARLPGTELLIQVATDGMVGAPIAEPSSNFLPRNSRVALGAKPFCIVSLAVSMEHNHQALSPWTGPEISTALRTSAA